MEGTASRQRPGIRRLTPDDRSLAQAVGRVGFGHGRQQRPRVGVERVGDEVGRGCQLHDAAGVHDGDALREMACAGKVVGDVQDGQVVQRLQLVEQVEDLGPAGRVDHGDRLVSHQVVRPQHHGSRDADALPLSARERVRVALDHLGSGSQLDLLEGRQDPRVTLRPVLRAVDDERLRHDLADPHVGAEAGERILEDGLGALAEAGQGSTLEGAHVGALEDDAASGERDEPKRGATQRRLAAA
jgi:hypothetical protein